MSIYVELEEKTLMEALDKLIQVYIYHYFLKLQLASIFVNFVLRWNSQMISPIRKLISNLCTFVQEESWEFEEGSQSHILGSGTQVCLPCM